MSTIAENAKAIFLQAIEKNAEEWPAFLDQACGDDAELRQRVEGLLQAHQEKDSLFDQIDSTVDHQSSESLGQMIGPYKLREQIGEGGMGTIFVAEQRRPVHRKVALKVIKPGMDSKSIIARFEAERQALAMMDHPNIAKVLDAGTTDAGRPYFAMELVKGVPITDYCDRNRLTIRERLELFIQVCHAIQHAHQKGIIHRDIKPSNVLVTLHDGKPVVKVIDFGVAKALNARLTDRTVYTEHLQIVGTLLYMSPEQAEMSGLDIDTRSDIYSLGVLLYELLTGSTPFSKRELEIVGLDEQRRIICNQDPPRPSIRISSLGETATVVAEARRTDERKLNRILQRDLDWILLKALDKDRSRRYETAVQFANDASRYLQDKPVEARRPNAIYRLRKFARRNRVAVALSAGVFAAAAVCVLALFGMYREQRRSRAYFSDAITASRLIEANHEARDHNAMEAEELLLKAKTLLEGHPDDSLRQEVYGELGFLYVRFHNDFLRGIPAYQKAIDLENSGPTLHELPTSHWLFLLGIAQWELGNDDDAVSCFERAGHADQRAGNKQNSWHHVSNHLILAGLCYKSGKTARALELYRPYDQRLKKEVADAAGTHRHAGRTVWLTTYYLLRADLATDSAERNEFLQRALDSSRIHVTTGKSPNHRHEFSTSLKHLTARVLITAGDNEAALAALLEASRESLSEIRKRRGNHFSMSVLNTRTLRDVQHQLIDLLQSQGQGDRAVQLLAEQLAELRAILPADHHQLAYSLQMLGELQLQQDQVKEAKASLAEAEGRFASYGTLLSKQRTRCSQLLSQVHRTSRKASPKQQ